MKKNGKLCVMLGVFIGLELSGLSSARAAMMAEDEFIGHFEEMPNDDLVVTSHPSITPHEISNYTSADVNAGAITVHNVTDTVVTEQIVAPVLAKNVANIAPDRPTGNDADSVNVNAPPAILKSASSSHEEGLASSLQNVAPNANDVTGTADRTLTAPLGDRITGLLSQNSIEQEDLKPLTSHITKLSELMQGSGKGSRLQKISGVSRNPFDAGGLSSDMSNTALGKITNALMASDPSQGYITWSRQGTIGADVTPWFGASLAKKIGIPVVAAIGPEAFTNFTSGTDISAGHDGSNYFISYNKATETKIGLGGAAYIGAIASLPGGSVEVDAGGGAELLHVAGFSDRTGVTFFTPRNGGNGSENRPDSLIKIANAINEGGSGHEILGKIATLNAPDVFMKINTGKGDSSVTSATFFGRVRGRAVGGAVGVLGVLEASHTSSIFESAESGDTVTSSTTVQRGARLDGAVLATGNQTLDVKLGSNLDAGNTSQHHALPFGFSKGVILTDSTVRTGATDVTTSKEFNNLQEFKSYILNPANGYASKINDGSQLKPEYESQYRQLVGESTGGEKYRISSNQSGNVFSSRATESLPSNSGPIRRGIVSRGLSGLFKLNFKSSATQTRPALDATKAIDPSQKGLTVRGFLLGLGGAIHTPRAK
ncbi:hypothetical protein [Paraburkholderia heleia]|uniref:hypothetical protein n=1 Tax=Paraburkholderia heleia TaxID=634127 RepID=UPI002AB6793D|nr:hypothetical protein [Paraburkholderia heleia]